MNGCRWSMVDGRLERGGEREGRGGRRRSSSAKYIRYWRNVARPMPRQADGARHRGIVQASKRHGGARDGRSCTFRQDRYVPYSIS